MSDLYYTCNCIKCQWPSACTCTCMYTVWMSVCVCACVRVYVCVCLCVCVVLDVSTFICEILVLYVWSLSPADTCSSHLSPPSLLSSPPLSLFLFSRCPYLHRNAGDTERRYHLRYYKTSTCVYETDSRGFCVKNGPHCAFAHGPHDLRSPVYDIRELTGEGEEDRLVSPLVGSLEREKGVLVDDPRWHGKPHPSQNMPSVIFPTCKDLFW